MPASASSAVTPHYSTPAQHATRAIAPGDLTRLLVEGAKCIHDVIETDRLAAIESPAHCRNGVDCTGVGRPRGEDCALFVQSEIGIVDDI
jgi:hypothetical protein